ncbi:hypothetical protein BS17DRAFT_818427 [Gyrodon lividus]|nr:hypothetical protein BS17DRAFT_818427 [Gyrodon lividus]
MPKHFTLRLGKLSNQKESTQRQPSYSSLREPLPQPVRSSNRVEGGDIVGPSYSPNQTELRVPGPNPHLSLLQPGVSSSNPGDTSQDGNVAAPPDSFNQSRLSPPHPLCSSSNPVDAAQDGDIAASDSSHQTEPPQPNSGDASQDGNVAGLSHPSNQAEPGVPDPNPHLFLLQSGPSPNAGDASQDGSVAGLSHPSKQVEHLERVSDSNIGPAHTINIILFGETGVGKSSVINLIAGKEVAKVSSDVDGCTMASTPYDVTLGNKKIRIFDTVGLEEPQMGVNGYLAAIEKAHKLIQSLGAGGGVHLLLFCMRGGRITATVQSNYRLFCEFLCNKKVPVALVFTGLEREVDMENWWTRNESHIRRYGIHSVSHACITAVRDDTSGQDDKYVKSERMIRELLVSLDSDTAKRIAELMRKGEEEAEAATQVDGDGTS